MSRELLKSMIDLVDEEKLDTIYKMVVRFVPESHILPDEEISLKEAQRDRANGDIFTHEEVWA